MNPLLFVIYQLLKLLTRVALRIYFPNTTVINRRRLRFDHPAIVVSNHPNTLLDPLNTAARIKKQVFFLANAGLFRNPFSRWFFNTFYCIPIERPQDTNGGPLRNEASFARADRFLGDGGVLYIAPEGTSEMERRMRDLKTGTARIALSAEQKEGFELGLAIIPVGLTYSAPDHFRSRLVVNVGEPLYLREFREDYNQDQISAVRQITESLDQRLRSLTIDTREESQDLLLRRIEEMIQNDLPLGPEERFFREQGLLAYLNELQDQHPDRFSALQEKAGDYFEALATQRLSDAAVARLAQGKSLTGFSDLIMLMAGWPVFIHGWVNNWLPAVIPGWAARKADLYIGYHSAARIVGGMVTFPLFYWLQTKAVAYLLGQPAAWWYLLSLPFCGWLAWDWRNWWQGFRQRYRLQRLDKEQTKSLLDRRIALTGSVNSR